MSKQTGKKISLASAIIFVLSSVIGAGIFVKNGSILQNTGGGNLGIILTICSWVIATIGIVAMALTLKEMVQYSGKNNIEGVNGWVKTYNSNFLYKSSNNFMLYIYLPTNFFFMPIYAVDQLFNGIGYTSCPWYLLLIISFFITLYFVLTSGWSAKATDFHSKLTMAFKFLPIAVAIVIGYIFLGDTTHGGYRAPDVSSSDPFISLSPFVGMFMSIPAIFFAYDGFYSTTSISDKMEKPQKYPVALVLGLLIVAIIYFLISLSLVFFNNGRLAFNGEAEGFWGSDTWRYICMVLQICISVGILGIINGFSLYGSGLYQFAIKKGDLPFSGAFKRYCSNDDEPKGGMLYSLFVYTIFFILFSIIGCFYFNNYGGDYADTTYAKLLSFSDLLSNWSSLFAFIFIAFAIFGCMKMEFKNKKNPKYFIPACITAVTIIGIASLFSVVQVFYDIIYSSINFDKDEFLGSIMLLVAFILTVGFTFVPTFFMKKNVNK